MFQEIVVPKLMCNFRDSGVSSIHADSIRESPAVHRFRTATVPIPQTLASSTHCTFSQSTTQLPSQLAKSHKTHQPAAPTQESFYPNSFPRPSDLQLAILAKAMAMAHRPPFSTLQLRPLKRTIEQGTRETQLPETLRSRPQLADRARLRGRNLSYQSCFGPDELKGQSLGDVVEVYCGRLEEPDSRLSTVPPDHLHDDAADLDLARWCSRARLQRPLRCLQRVYVVLHSRVARSWIQLTAEE